MTRPAFYQYHRIRHLFLAASPSGQQRIAYQPTRAIKKGVSRSKPNHSSQLREHFLSHHKDITEQLAQTASALAGDFSGVPIVVTGRYMGLGQE